MLPGRRALTSVFTLGLSFAIAACSPTASPTPSTSDISVVDGVTVGCVSFEQVECETVARLVLARVPAGPVAPFSILMTLFECPNGGACPKSLTAREGTATVDFAGGRDPEQFTLGGPPDSPRIQASDGSWSGAIQPRSARVAGVGPFPLELGHCGLLWQVDFDGSFWVPVGQIDGTATELINSGSGFVRLLGPNLAVYTGADGFTAGLQRFPGPKHVFLCG